MREPSGSRFFVLGEVGGNLEQPSGPFRDGSH